MTGTGMLEGCAKRVRMQLLREIEKPLLKLTVRRMMLTGCCSFQEVAGADCGWTFAVGALRLTTLFLNFLAPKWVGMFVGISADSLFLSGKRTSACSSSSKVEKTPKEKATHNQLIALPWKPVKQIHKKQSSLLKPLVVFNNHTVLL